MRPVTALLLVLAALPATAARTTRQAELPTGFTIDTLAPGVVAFVRREPPGYGMQSNSLLIIGNRYAAVVDAQMNRTDTREVIAAIRGITPKPVRYVINTHCHDDHVTGNVEYATAFPGAEPALRPTRAFEGSVILDLGGRSIVRRQLGRGHSRGDVVVQVPDAQIIAAGDLVVCPVPFVGTTSYPGDFAGALAAMLALRPAAILPGHGPVLRDTTYVRDVARMLESIKSQVAAAVAGGDSLPAVRKTVDLSEFRALFGGESKLRLGLFDQYVKASAIPAEYNAQTRR